MSPSDSACYPLRYYLQSPLYLQTPLFISPLLVGNVAGALCSKPEDHNLMQYLEKEPYKFEARTHPPPSGFPSSKWVQDAEGYGTQYERLTQDSNSCRRLEVLDAFTISNTQAG